MNTLRAFLVLLCVPAVAASQKPQSFSLSGAAVAIDFMGQDLGSVDLGGGFEVQVRYHASGTRGPSFGVGYFATRHTASGGPEIELWGVTFEPRLAFGPDSSTFRLYVAGRFASIRQRSAVAIQAFAGSFVAPGVGGTYQVADRVQVDVCAAYGFVSFPDQSSSGTTLNVRVGVVFLLGI